MDLSEQAKNWKDIGRARRSGLEHRLWLGAGTIRISMQLHECFPQD
jgi:hypothetical protein